MGRKDEAAARKAADQLKQSRQALSNWSSKNKGGSETGEYHKLNRAVADAEKKVSWWKR